MMTFVLMVAVAIAGSLLVISQIGVHWAWAILVAPATLALTVVLAEWSVRRYPPRCSR